MDRNLYIIKKFQYGDDRDENPSDYEYLGAVIAKDLSEAIWAASIAKIATTEQLKNNVLYSIESFTPLDADCTIFKF